MLISLEAAKEDLQMDHDLDDDDITRKIKQASFSVLTYMDEGLDVFDDSDGEIPLDSDGDPDVSYNARAATTLLTRMLYKGEVEMNQLEHGYLPLPVMNLLYPNRLPAMA
jgi:hypothetical protein